MIDKLSEALSEKLKNTFPEEMPSKGILKYSIKFIISNIIPIIVIMGISMVVGKEFEVLMALMGFSILRMFSGGYHLKSATACIIVSTMMIFSISSIGMFVGRFSFYLLVFSLILVSIYAPSNITKMTRVKKENFFIFKIISILIVSSNFIIRNDILTTSFLFQSLLLINLKGGVKVCKRRL